MLKTSTYLSLYLLSVRDEFREIREYIDNLDNLLSQEYNRIISIVNNEQNKNPENSIDIADNYAIEFFQFGETYPAILKSSLLITAYSFFESKLKKICEEIQQRENIKLKVTDINGRNYIEKARKYLEKVIGVNLKDLNNEWNEIIKFQRVRNLITHNNSNAWKDKDNPIKNQSKEVKSTIEFLKNNRYISYNSDHGDFIIVDSKFVLEFYKNIEVYYTNLVGILIDHYKIMAANQV